MRTEKTIRTNSKDNMDTPQNKNTNNTGNNNRRPGGAPGPVRPMR